jgi:predicted nucleic acid-binding protein
MPSEWLTLDLGPGELGALALALENPTHIVLLDDRLARRIAQAAGLTTWGTLKILLEAKTQGLTESLAPLIDKLEKAGMWLSDDIRQRVLALAGEQ